MGACRTLLGGVTTTQPITAIAVFYDTAGIPGRL
jgi:hypothetical protein